MVRAIGIYANAPSRLIRSQKAQQYCQIAAELRPAYPDSFLNLAKLDIALGQNTKLVNHLNKARHFSKQQIDGHEFGLASIKRVEQHLNRKHQIDALANRAYLSLSTDDKKKTALEAVLSTPEIHKSIAMGLDHLFYSSNEGGHYNLWRIPKTGGSAELLSNNVRSAFRLQSDLYQRNIFYLADVKGDYRYRLFQKKMLTGRDFEIGDVATQGSVEEYQLSHSGRYITYSTVKSQSRTLRLYDTVSGKNTVILENLPKVSNIRWMSDDQRFYLY